MRTVYDYISTNKESFVRRLLPLLAQPSVSAHKQGMEQCARMLADMMEGVGVRTRIIPTDGEPVVFGLLDEGAANTLLVYGHYDVQPPEPLELWDMPPFEPTVRGGRIYARGAADNKGQLFAHLMAVAALKATRGRVGCNIKFLFEGEEEVGSPNLEPFVRRYADLLRADAAYTADALQHPAGHPYIFPGLKGMLTIELTCRGPNRDRHSAMADIIENPAWRLVHALASMRAPGGDVLVEGFDTDIVPLTPRERELLEAAPDPKEQLKRDLGLRRLLPAAEENFHVARTAPTFNISGIHSGYTGPGTKTVLPSVASAKLDIRLVPHQDPDDVSRRIREHLDRYGFHDIEMVVTGKTVPSLTNPDHPFVRLVTDAAREGFGREPLLYPRVVGSGPDYVFTRLLQIPSVIVPYAGAGSEPHAPNENISIDAFIQGIRVSATVFAKLASAAMSRVE